MGIFDRVEQFGPGITVSQGLKLPISIGAYMVRPVMRSVGIGLDLDHRIRQAPLHEAGLGAEVIENGHERDDQALKHLGEAMIASAVVKADQNDVVPGKIVKKVVELAVESNLDPHNNPLIHEDSAAQIVEIIEEHS